MVDNDETKNEDSIVSLSFRDFYELNDLLPYLEDDEYRWDIPDENGDELVFEVPEDIDTKDLDEVVHRVRKKIGGFKITIRKIGHTSAAGRRRARKAVRHGRSKRKIALRRFWRSAKARRLVKLLSRLRKRRRPVAKSITRYSK